MIELFKVWKSATSLTVSPATSGVSGGAVCPGGRLARSPPPHPPTREAKEKTAATTDEVRRMAPPVCNFSAISQTSTRRNESRRWRARHGWPILHLSLIHISEPTRLL